MFLCGIVFFGWKASPFLHQIFYRSLCPKSLIFVLSLHSTCSNKQFSFSKNTLAKLNQATTWYGLWRRVCNGWFPYSPCVFKQNYIVQILMLIPIVSKLLVMSFKTTLAFILTSWQVSCSSWWQFRISSMPR